MMKYILAATTLLATLAQVQAQKKNVVFVHGLAGFGPDELFGIGYWAQGRIFKEFPEDEWNVYEAEVGAVSSNWDRACELYAQIVGGKVDYGKSHSTKYDHARMSTKEYAGFVPDWSPDNPVHLVGHSMGSQTIRLLEILMQEGDQDERDATGEDTSPLFRGGHTGYVKSITNISGPLDGSTLTTILGDGGVDLIRQLILFFASLGGLDPAEDEFLYDFGLDQWGLEKLDGENTKAYFDRVFSSRFFTESGFKDLASHDLTLDGAAELNMRGKQSYPETFYFSLVTENMHRGLFPVAHNMYYHDVDMIPLLWPFADLLGTYGGNFGPWTPWHENDGLVPTISQECPKLGYSSEYQNCKNDMPRNTNNIEPGKWYAKKYDMDHIQVIGLSLIKDPVPMYRNHVGVLSSIHNRATFAARAGSVESITNSIDMPMASIIGSAGLAVGVLVGAGVTIMVRRNRKPKVSEVTELTELEEATSPWASFASSKRETRGTFSSDNPRMGETE